MSALNSLLSHLEKGTVLSAKVESTEKYKKMTLIVSDDERLVVTERLPYLGRGGGIIVELNGVVIMGD